ncbi:MAG: hypothetical protein NZO58_01700 [Gemmataceae bacterium]|nr:hypothetical protein [Gemmataceae bacterium]
MRQALPGDAVIIDVALIERELGDPFLNEELWNSTDEMVVDLATKAVLEANGLRVGQVVGMTPAQLQRLLSSERWCINPQRFIHAAGKTTTHYLGPVLPHCDYDLRVGGTVQEVRVDRARFCFEVLATLTDNGKTKLTFTPKVETAEQVLPYQPSADLSRWQIKIERPGTAYPELRWEAKLAPNEYLVVGALLDKPGTFGHCALVEEDGSRPAQRLYVVRTSRSLTDELPALADRPLWSQSPPLAAQAGLSGIIRASRP